ncbi:MAG: TVP38/TMEM64 family protein [Hyphomicrobiales bacterium]
MASESAYGKERRTGSALLRALPLVVILAAMVLAFAMGWHRYLSLASLIEYREALATFVADNRFLALAVYFAVYVATVALSLPGASILTIAGAVLFGWVVGALLTVFAATIGATLLFLAARSSLGAVLAARAGPFLSRLGAGFREDAFGYLLFLRLVPAFPFWLVNLAPALLEVPLRTFFLATFIGIIPGTAAYSFLGAGLDSVVAAQRAANPECAADPAYRDARPLRPRHARAHPCLPRPRSRCPCPGCPEEVASHTLEGR